VRCCCEMVAAEARDIWGTQREMERRPLEANTKQRLVETVNSRALSKVR
jgi:hypothetical protein